MHLDRPPPGESKVLGKGTSLWHLFLIRFQRSAGSSRHVSFCTTSSRRRQHDHQRQQLKLGTASLSGCKVSFDHGLFGGEGVGVRGQGHAYSMVDNFWHSKNTVEQGILVERHPTKYIPLQRRTTVLGKVIGCRYSSTER